MFRLSFGRRNPRFCGAYRSGPKRSDAGRIRVEEKYDGNITLFGKAVHFTSAVDALDSGMAFVPEDRKLEGLYHVQSVKYNATIEVLKEFIKGFVFNKKRNRDCG